MMCAGIIWFFDLNVCVCCVLLLLFHYYFCKSLSLRACVCVFVLLDLIEALWKLQLEKTLRKKESNKVSMNCSVKICALCGLHWAVCMSHKTVFFILFCCCFEFSLMFLFLLVYISVITAHFRIVNVGYICARVCECVCVRECDMLNCKCFKLIYSNCAQNVYCAKQCIRWSRFCSTHTLSRSPARSPCWPIDVTILYGNFIHR